MKTWNLSTEKVLNGRNNIGYIYNRLFFNRTNQRLVQVSYLNHRFVKERFLNPVDGVNMEVHHINGVRWDNRPVKYGINLQSITQTLNHAYAHGRPIIVRCVRVDEGVVTYVSASSCCRFFNIIRSNFDER